MQELDLLFRITGAVVLLLTGLLVVRGAGRRVSGTLFFLFALGVTAYLIGNVVLISIALTIRHAKTRGYFKITRRDLIWRGNQAEI